MIPSTSTSSPSRLTRKRSLYLSGILVVLLVGLCYLLPQDPIIAARLTTLFGGDPIPLRPGVDDAKQEKSDPPPGTPLPDSGAGAEIRSSTPHSQNGYFVVGLGDCMSCIAFSFADWERYSASHHIALVGFSGAQRPLIAKYRQVSRITIPIYPDEGSQLLGAINAYWNGRVYYFDADWRLRWTMKGFANPYHADQLPDLQAALSKGGDKK